MFNEMKTNPGSSMQFQNIASINKSETSSDSRSNSTSPPASTHILNMVQEPVIRDVWQDNMEDEFKTIMNLIDKYNIIGMDTEFPGIVLRYNDNYFNGFTNFSEIEYKTIKSNVDVLKVIQVGISLASEEGLIPEGVTTWQFNFQFDLNVDKHAQDAIDLLSNSGIKFDSHAKRGIDPHLFAEYMISSGLALNDDIKWISFHGGFDFAYLIKMLNGTVLPDNDSDFYKLLSTYFPQFYDIKYMVKDLDSLKTGGLNKLATDVNVRRIGPQHQAGSDSLLTLQTYFKLKDTYLKNVPDKKYNNLLHGIGGEIDESSSYVWDNYVMPSDNYFTMMNYGFGMNGNPIMNTNFYPQTDPMYNGLNSGFPINYNPMFNGFGQGMPFMDANQKPKGKMDMFSNKVKS